MTEAQTYSWIFYAASASCAKEGANIRDIEAVADGINHAVPTSKEMTQSLKWAESKGLITKEGKKFVITRDGQDLIAQVSSRGGSAMKIWERYTRLFEKLGAENVTHLNCQTMKAEPASGANAG
ncbi:hypothetical protein JIN85_20965 [Luteolibacter pohnpeiensis]|uniref:Uncharacterized protein n=2 Tax=Luteolibacter pohnpeiensis TaxID=454153 RepID=A0A934SBD6_9BACT|nr:hypothetical protein [Luteolibacter pohnpeiensis]